MGRLNTVSLGGSHLLTALCYLHGQAVLVAEVVGLAVRPVGPLGRGVHVRPEPGAGVVRVVPTLNTAHIEMYVSLQIANSCGFIIQKTPNIHLL